MLREIRDRLIEIEKTVASVRSVASRVPPNAQNFEAPVVFNTPVAVSVSGQDDVGVVYVVTWRVECLVSQVNLSLRASSEDAVIDITDDLLAAFCKSPRLEYQGNALSNVLSAQVTNVSIIVTGFPAGSVEQLWYAIQLTLQVEYVKGRC